MFDTILRHKLIASLILVIIIVVAWYELSASPSAPAGLLTTTAPAGPDQQLVSTLLTLRAVTLSGTILSDTAFRSLKDFSTQIMPEPVGRSDPFAPVAGAANVSQASTTPAAQNTHLFAPKK